ncbi:jerky protein homolog-like [Rhizophagus clarus]|uniref:Jerky protein homolog-like n=1 Tax=Rhizophagus clarus TaxID=94130 RepID=A0A8H3MHR4_9GLOM|nr:jerky protein homolog-like [Rhizophagus clarus]
MPFAEFIENNYLALQEFLNSYNPEDIWNGDETKLFWKMELSRILARDPISDHKKKKSQVTIFCAVNATGTEKMILLFIHKYKTPRAIKNLNYKNLPVYYFWNKKSWMQVNETQEKLDSITVKFLSPNTTSTAFQPYGIVEKLANYNIFEALQNSAEACIEDEEAEPEKLITLLPEGDYLNAREYINIEDEIAESALTDDEIINSVLNSDKEEEIVMDENESMSVMEKISLKETEKAVNNITQFLYEQRSEFGKVNEELRILKGLHKCIKLLIVKNLKQLNLNNFCNDIID